jgi:cell division transport system ATP-binding protein
MQNVGLRYNRGGEVLRDVTFHLRPGSFHFLTGPSGAGKTSLLRMFFMSLKPTRGSMHIFGQDVSRLSTAKRSQLRRRVGIVFQDFRLLDHLTVVDNIALPLRIAGVRDGVVREHVAELLNWISLTHHADSKPPILSDGEKQRVAIARAVIARPSLLLADEPTGNLDPDLGLRLTQLFAELNKVGTTVVMATHNESLAVRFPFATLQIAEGQVTQGGRRVAPLV